MKDFLRSYTGGPNAYLRGQTFALSTPDAGYWEGYGVRKGQAAPRSRGGTRPSSPMDPA